MVSHRVQDLARMAGQVIPRTPPVSALFLLALELLTWTDTPTFYMRVWDSWPRACSGCTFTHPSNHHLSSSSHTVMVPKYRVIKNSEEFLTFSQELHGLHSSPVGRYYSCLQPVWGPSPTLFPFLFKAQEREPLTTMLLLLCVTTADRWGSLNSSVCFLFSI